MLLSHEAVFSENPKLKLAWYIRPTSHFRC